MKTNYSSRINKFLLTAWLLIVCTSIEAKQDPVQVVSVNGEEISYQGMIETESNQRLFALFDDSSPKPSKLIINSSGGTIEHGLELGEWVLENNLDVHIPEMCQGTCANYVLIAARKVRLGKHALISWHGGPVADEIAEGTADEAVRWAGVSKELQKMGIAASEQKSYWRNVLTRNRNFYQAAEVSPLIALPILFANQELTAQIVEHSQNKNQGAIGTYLSLSDMKKLGVTNVEVENSAQWDPTKNPQYNDSIFLVTLGSQFEATLHALNAKIAYSSWEASLKDDSLYYSGALDLKKNEQIFKLYAEAQVKPTTLTINSTGGHVEYGMELGEWIHEKGLSVYIPELCISSCANYVLTAATNTRLGQHALIYWHGSPIGADLVPKSQQSQNARDLYETEKRLGVIQDESFDDWFEIRERVRVRNRQFFNLVGVNPLITTTTGVVHPDSLKKLEKYENYSQFGFYYSIKDMLFFGLDNIAVEGSNTWDPTKNKLYTEDILLFQLADNADEQLRVLNEQLESNLKTLESE